MGEAHRVARISYAPRDPGLAIPQGFEVDDVLLREPAVACAAPDCTGLADRMVAGAYRTAWLDLEPEAVLAILRVLQPLQIDVLVASPMASRAIELDTLLGLGCMSGSLLSAAGRLYGSRELRGVLPDVFRPSSRVLLKLIADTAGLESGVSSRPARNAILGAVADGLAFLHQHGCRWKSVRLANTPSAGYWDLLDARLEGGDSDVRLVVMPAGATDEEVLDHEHEGERLQWRRRPGQIRIARKGPGGKSAEDTPYPGHLERMLLEARNRARGWLDDELAHRKATFADALELVDAFLYGSAWELKKLSQQANVETLANFKGPLKDSRTRLANFQNQVIADIGLCEPFAERLPGPPPRLLLVRTPTLSSEWMETIIPPLGMAQLAAVAGRLGAETTLVDLAPEVPYDPARTVADIDVDALFGKVLAGCDGRTFDLVGFSVIDPGTWPVVEALARKARGVLGPRVVLGGVGAQPLDRAQVAASGAVDYLVSNEGELGILMLLRHARGAGTLDEVPGLWNVASGQSFVCISPDLRLHPPPDFDGLDLSRYRSGKAQIETPFLPYQFILGCPCRCSFCSALSGQTPRIRPLDRVVSDLRHLRDRYGVKNFMFLNNEINPWPRFVDEFLDCMEAADLGIRWADCGRPALLTRRQIERLAGVGCAALAWGIDTGSQKMGDFVKKRYDIARSEVILRQAHEAGIANYVNLIVGMPRETEREFEEGRAFLNRILPYAEWIYLMPYQYLPNSPLRETPREFGLRRKADIYDEIDGISWPEHVETMYRRREILRGDIWAYQVLKRGGGRQ